MSDKKWMLCVYKSTSQKISTLFYSFWNDDVTLLYLELLEDLRIFGEELLVLTRDGVEGEEQALDLGELELGVRDLARVHDLG